MSGATVDVVLKRTNKIYREGETVEGSVVVVSPGGELRHEGISLEVEGCVHLQRGGGGGGGASKSWRVLEIALDVQPGGRLPAGRTELPFAFALRPAAKKRLHETYHGVFVSVAYAIRCTMRRSSFLGKRVSVERQFVVQQRPGAGAAPDSKPVRCVISPQTVQNAAERMPNFDALAELDSTVCSLDDPFTGRITVKECSVPIKSIELQLVRVETCGGSADGYARDATEVQNIQLGEGDVCRNVPIPIYMLLPRLFTCPTVLSDNFKIEFEVNVAIIFQDDHLVTENFPIVLVRN